MVGSSSESINENAKVLSIIIYSDTTTCDILRKISERPIFLSLGNIPGWRRNKPDSKALLAYLPKINNQKNRKDFALIKHQLFRHSMEILLEPIKPGSNIDLRTDVGILWCCPFLSILLGDLPEHHSIMLTYNSANCKMPCHTCLTLKEEFNNPLIDYSTIQIQMMQNILENKIFEEYSLHNIVNSEIF